MEKKLLGKLDNFKEVTKSTAELTHKKTKEFHDQYVSKITPDCGKYGDATKFAAEMAPGVGEYNAIKDGDWEAFGVEAGIDLASGVVGGISGGAGYAAVKGANSFGKAAGKELAEKGIKEVSEKGVKTIDVKKFDNYIESLQKITKQEIKPIQMDKIKKSAKNDVFAKLDSNSYKIKLREFQRGRKDIIKEWEKHNGMKWPTYTEDVVKDGVIKKRKGQPFDAHHIIEKQFDGANKWWNIIPATKFQHQETIHAGIDMAKDIFKE